MILKNQPLDIKNKDNPFEEDKLGRDKNIDSLTQLLTNSAGSFVLAVDAPWGSGKTTFIKMWEQYLKNECFPVIYFNAWESDFSDNALVSLIGEIETGLKTIDIPQKNKSRVNKSFNKAKKIGAQLIKSSVPIILKAATAGLMDVKEEYEKAFSDLSGKIAEVSIKQYEESRQSIESLKKELANFAGSISGAEDEESGKPLIIFIDELDRCRPTYAIEVLEKVKHIFDVPNIIFVLGIDKKELGHSIKSVYGSEFSVEGYLRRFIDVTYDLPTGDKGKFLEYLFDRFGISEYLKKFKANAERNIARYLQEIFPIIFEHFKFSLRDQEQFIAHLNIVLRTFTLNSYLFEELIVFLLILKNVNRKLYKKLINYEFKISEISSFLDVFPKDIPRINFLLEIVEVDLYICLKNERKYWDDIETKIKNYKSLTQSDDAAQKQESTSFLQQYNHRDVRRGIELDWLIKKIELLDDLKINE